MNKFRLLKANEIECRIGTINEKGLTLLLYKDARVDMNILDETVGEENWQRDHKELKGNIYCGISIWDGNKSQWITKWDCGSESYTEKEKGEASDSFKRAGFNWGIGRELYSSPFIWVSKDNCNITADKKCYDTFNVTKIGYNENREISELVIENNKTKKVIFSFGNIKQERDFKKELELFIKNKGLDKTEVCKEYKLNAKSTNEDFEIALNELESVCSASIGERLGQ